MNIDISLLRGRHVYLKLLEVGHRNMIRTLARDERIWEFNKMLIVDANYDRMFDAYFDLALNTEALGGQQSFLIRQVKDDVVIGMTRLYEISEKDKLATIGYTWYIPAVWGKVHNKECKLLLLQYIFETLQFNRAELRVAHQNIRSQKAVEKIGAKQEGLLRKHGYRNDGSMKHTFIYSIIDEEWSDVKEKLVQLIRETENH